MDVIFHAKMFFYPTGITNSSLQGEFRDEVQNQDEIRFFEIMRPSSIEFEIADTSSIECSVKGREDQDSLEVLPDPIPVDSNSHDIVSITEAAS